MPFNDFSEYPRGMETGDCTGAVNVNSGNGMKINQITLSNVSAATIDLTISGTIDPSGINTAYSFICPLAADAVVTLPGWQGTLAFSAGGADVKYLVTWQLT